MEKDSFQLLDNPNVDPNVQNRNRRTFANKCQTLLVVLLLIINIFTIGLGYALFKKLTELPNYQGEYMNVENEFTGIEKQTEELNDAVRTLGNNVTEQNDTILDIIRRMNGIIQNVSRIMVKDGRSIEATIAVEKMLTGCMNMSTEIEKIRQRMDKDKNNGQKQVLNITRRIDALEATKNVLEKKFSESSNHTPTIARVIWKFENFTSKVVDRNQSWSKIYYGPSLNTSQFGNRIRFICKMSNHGIEMSIECLKDDCRILLDQPFHANITYFISNETGEQFTNMVDVYTEKSECAQSKWKPIEEDINAYITSFCFFFRPYNSEHKWDFVKGNTAYLGIKVES